MDKRAWEAREAHFLAEDVGSLASRHRQKRNRLVRELREEDTGRWTYAALAAAVKCSPELIAAICQGRVAD